MRDPVGDFLPQALDHRSVGVDTTAVGRGGKKARCVGCRLHTEQCICALFAPVKNRTPVKIVMHRGERSKATNTSHLATKMVRNLALTTFASRDEAKALWSPNALLLFPGPGVPTLSPSDMSPRAELVLVDGTWRQATRILRRLDSSNHPFRRRQLPALSSQYWLRRNPMATGLATFEALAHAFGILESEDMKDRLLSVFDRFVEETMASRGRSSVAGR